MVLLAEDYNLKECTEIDSFGYCVKYEDLKRCVSSSDSECYTQCVTDGKTISLNPGCRKTLKTDGTTNITTCYTESNFYTACYDSTSCHSSNIYPVEVVLTLVVALLCVTAVCEFLYAVSLGRFAGYHPNDFQESQDDSSTALLYINRNMGKILQYGLCLMIVLMLFLVYASVTSGSTCSDAQTVQGEQYEFFDWALTYLTILSVIVPIFIIIGTIARFMMPFRGELYNPAFHGEGELPDLVDCGIWRYRARGSRCGNCNTLYNMGFKRTSALCAWLVDAFFCYCLCGQCIGWGIENSYKYRHYIGT